MDTTKLAEKYQVNEGTILSLIRYRDEKIPTGGFLNAILENNLFNAMGKADQINRFQIFGICQFINMELPIGIYGSPKKVNEHLRN